MNYFLLQLVLAQNQDIEKWMNILFIVVLAVFWALRGVVKSKFDEAQRQKHKQRAIEKTRRPSSSTKDLSELLLEKVLGPTSSSKRTHHYPDTQNSISKASPSRTVVHKLAVRPQPDLSVPYQIERKKKSSKFFFKQPSFEPKIQDFKKFDTRIEKLPDFVTKSVDTLADSPLNKPTVDTSHARYFSDFLLDLKNSDELRRAILHYEILGRPLSLRDPSESLR